MTLVPQGPGVAVRVEGGQVCRAMFFSVRFLASRPGGTSRTNPMPASPVGGRRAECRHSASRWRPTSPRSSSPRGRGAGEKTCVVRGGGCPVPQELSGVGVGECTCATTAAQCGVACSGTPPRCAAMKWLPMKPLPTTRGVHDAGPGWGVSASGRGGVPGSNRGAPSCGSPRRTTHRERWAARGVALKRTTAAAGGAGTCHALATATRARRRSCA